jgi:hypothetical protein
MLEEAEDQKLFALTENYAKNEPETEKPTSESLLTWAGGLCLSFQFEVSPQGLYSFKPIASVRAKPWQEYCRA